MLTELRNVTRGWIALAVIGLLALAFAIWGINDVFRPIQSNDVASGRGVAVTQQQFNLAFDNELKRARQQSGRVVTRQEAVDANLHMRLIEQLANQQVFDRLARRAGVNASNEMVAREIRDMAAFTNPVTGTFDAGSYRTMLAQNGLTTALFETDIRSELIRRQFADALVAGIRPPTSFGRMAIAYESERRTISIAAVTPERAGAPPAPSDAEIEAFYKAQSQAFALPEYRAFTVISADPADFAARVDVPAAEIERLFQFRRAQLVTPERRSFVLLSGAADNATAAKAGQRLAAGEAPAQVARTTGMQVQTFEAKAKTEAPETRVGEAVFATPAGAVTTPIQGVTWSVAKVSSVTPGATPSLDDVREDLRAELAADEAQTLMNDAVEKFDDVRAGGAAIEEAAAQAGLTVSKVPLIDARGLAVDGRPEASVLDQTEVVQTAFAAGEAEPTDWVSTEAGGSFLVRIDTIRPAGAPPLEQVRERVANAWRMQRTADAMKGVADAISKAVAEGTSFADAARAQRVPVVAAAQTITRREAGESTVSRQLMGAAFTAAKGDVVTGAGGPNGSILFVARVEDIVRDDPSANPQLLEAARRSLDAMIAEDMLATVQNVARQEARVRLNQPLIDRLVGKTSADAENEQ